MNYYSLPIYIYNSGILYLPRYDSLPNHLPWQLLVHKLFTQIDIMTSNCLVNWFHRLILQENPHRRSLGFPVWKTWPSPTHCVRELAAWGTPRDRIAWHVSPKWKATAAEWENRKQYISGWWWLEPWNFPGESMVNLWFYMVNNLIMVNNWNNNISGWWWLEPWNFEWLSHHIGNVMIPIDELHHFSEGLKPPTSMYIYINRDMQWDLEYE